MTKRWVFMRIFLFFIISPMMLITGIADASVVIQSTRIIYPAGQKNVTVQLVNNSETSSLVQSWIDEGDIDSMPETTTAPFIVTPPITKISAYDGTQLKIHFLGQALPEDRESVYYFNILDISPKSEEHQSVSQLKLTIQTRIKLFYRPQVLSAGIQKSLHKVNFYASHKNIIINNPTPYFITVANISSNKDKLLTHSVMLDPFSKKEIAIDRILPAGRYIDIDYIDDSGDYTTISKKIM